MSLIVLSVTTGNISIASFATVIGAPVGIASASFSLAFSIFTGIAKKLLKTTRNKMKKHNKIFSKKNFSPQEMFMSLFLFTS